MRQERLKNLYWKLIDGFTVRKVAFILLGCAITSFGLYNVHQQSHITEGGVLGMLLLLQHWFGIPASIANPILDVACYLLAAHFLGGSFLKLALFTSACMAGFFRIWEQFPPSCRTCPPIRCWLPSWARCSSASAWASSSARAAPAAATTPWR